MTAVSTIPARPPDAWAEIQEKREAANYAIQMRHSGALGDMEDHEFEAGIKRTKKTLERMHRILAEVLIPEVHYGIPKTRDGRNVFDKPMLYQAGADDVRKIGRWTLVDVRDPMITFDGEHLETVSFVGIRDIYGHILATASGACCTREPRFKKTSGEGWIFKDSREQLHNCLAHARKRAATMATLDACCGRSFFANAEAGGDIADALEADALMSSWTENDQERVLGVATAKGLGRGDLITLLATVPGLDAVPPAEQVGLVLRAIADWKKPVATTPPAGGGSAPAHVKCPKCGGPMWDERARKKTANSPDYKCKDKTCVNDKGYVTGAWEKDLKKAETKSADPQQTEPPRSPESRSPTREELERRPEALDREDDDLPF